MTNGKFYNAQGDEITWDGFSYSGQIDISSLKAKSIIIAYQASDVSVSGAHSLLKDINNNVLTYATENQYTFLKDGIAYMVLSSEQIAAYLYISHRNYSALGAESALSAESSLSTLAAAGSSTTGGSGRSTTWRSSPTPDESE